MPHIGGLEIGLIVLVILIVFGVGKLPQVGGALGKGIREFRKGQSGESTTSTPAETKGEKDVTKSTPKDEGEG